jgi:hypothetical protein
VKPLKAPQIDSVKVQAEKTGYRISDTFNVYENTAIRSKFFRGRERRKDIKTVVIHGTAGGHTLPWIERADPAVDPKRVALYKKGVGLFHYLIDRGSPHPDGRVIEVIDPQFWVNHSSVGAKDSESIGIELLIPDSRNELPPSEAQLRSLVDLCVYLKTIYPTVVEFVGHGRNMQRTSGGWKDCPGKRFPWTAFHDRLQTAFGDLPLARDPRFESVWFMR